MASIGHNSLTTPDPFFERVATWLGHLSCEGHNETMNRQKLGQLLQNAGFSVEETSP